MPRKKFHRAVFACAGIYNISWGIFSTFFPNWFFHFTGLAPLNHGEIWLTLAMVIGVYGLVYFEIARVPENGFVPAAVGLLGKVLGPIGMAFTIASGHWPPRAALLCLTNDLIWWIPFALYLKDSCPFFKKSFRG